MYYHLYYYNICWEESPNIFNSFVKIQFIYMEFGCFRCKIQLFLISSQSCVTITTINFSEVHSSHKERLSNSGHSIFILICFSTNFAFSTLFPFIGISHWWYHVICGLLCHASFISLRWVYVVACTNTSFFFIAECFNIFRYATFHLSIH